MGVWGLGGLGGVSIPCASLQSVGLRVLARALVGLGLALWLMLRGESGELGLGGDGGRLLDGDEGRPGDEGGGVTSLMGEKKLDRLETADAATCSSEKPEPCCLNCMGDGTSSSSCWSSPPCKKPFSAGVRGTVMTSSVMTLWKDLRELRGVLSTECGVGERDRVKSPITP